MSDGQNYIIVNNEAGSAISDGVADLVRYMDARGKTAVSPLAAEFKEVLGPQPSEELPLPDATQRIFITIAENAASLLNAPPSEFEPAFNLLWYVLSSAPNFESVTEVALSKLTQSYPTVHAQQLALLAVLGSLFNITSAQSQQKPVVFAKIVDLAIKAHAMAQIVPQLPQLAEWLREWNTSKEFKQELIKAIVDNVGPRSDAKVCEFLSSVVTFSPELTDASKALVSRVLNDPSAYNFESLLALPGVQALKGQSSDLYEALQLISVGDYAGFSKLSSSVTENPVLAKKAKVTAVARLASNVEKNELAYAEVSSALQLNEVEVEALLVDTIKAGLIRGRMSQLQQTFYVESVNVIGEVTDHHWGVIESRLDAWKKSLGAILDVSQRARSNHDLVKTLNKLEVN